MNCKKLLILVALFFLGFFQTNAQSVSCPPNIDFELGSLAYWNFYTGTCCPIAATTATSPLPGRHELMPLATAAPVDSCCSFPVLPPVGGGSYALKLGSRATGAKSEKARYYVHVPAGVTNYSLVYRYAVVMQFPGVGGHSSAQQPRFEVRAYDSISGTAVPCGTHNYVADAVAGLPGFFDTTTAPGASFSEPVRCKPWATEIINLSGYAGQTVVVDFMNGDCSLGGHFAYGYVDMTCGLFAASGVACDGVATLTAPVGFSSYLWFDSSSWAPVGTGNPVTVPTSSTTTYAVVMSPYPGYGCPDTLYTKVIPSILTVNASPDRDTICSTTSASISVVASDNPIYMPLTYSWAPAAGLSCTTCSNPIANPLTTTTYTVTVTCAAGCFKTDTVRIEVINNVIAETHTNPTKCGKGDGTITLSAAVPGSIAALTTYTVTYTFGTTPQTRVITSSGLGTILIDNLFQGTYTSITMTSAGPCPYNTIGPVVLTDPPLPVISFIGSNTPICQNDPINFTSTTGGAVDSFRWVGPAGFTNTNQNPTITPAIFANSGTYTLTVAKDSCIMTATTTVTVTPVPIPSAFNNTQICEYDTLKLFSASANGATSYSWSGPNAFSSYLQNPVLPNPGMIADGVYTVTINLGPCQAVATTTTTINPQPAAPDVTDVVYCQFDVASPMSATGTNLLWYTSPTGTPSTVAPTPNTAVPGTYTWYVTQTSSAGCVSPMSTVTARVFLLASPSLTVSDTVLCAGSHVMLTVKNSSSDEDYTGFVWTFSGGDSIKDLNPLLYSFEGLGTQTVSVTAKYTVCPDQTMTKTVTVFPQPLLNLGPDKTICPGSEAIVLGDPKDASGARWIWSTSEKTSSISVGFPGIYYAKKTIDGCIATDTVSIEKDCYLNLPNAFTPNGDGVNDYFFPRNFLSRGLTAFEMSIFNRWGELVFKTESTEGAGWDGKYNNIPQPQGVFVYVIEATFKDGQKEHHQGNVTLIR
jgi:gliding motility-associated-like protein